MYKIIITNNSYSLIDTTPNGWSQNKEFNVL